jgi:NAD(P)-dependent dehydrogenase (short-subunit alcohol dehydrogenase family)
MIEKPNATREQTVDYQDRQVLVTGGTGALGTAVVAGLIQAGANLPRALASRS